MKYKFSLIVATYNRKNELICLLNTLTTQTLNDFEVIIVDQNTKEYLTPIINSYRDSLNILHIISNKKGLSYNRNIGIRHASSNILCFPDDDCYYPDDILENVYKRLNYSGSFLTCNAKLDKNSTKHYFSKYSKSVNTYNVFKNAISFTIFVKFKNRNDVKFDDELGSGAKFGSGEETDMLLNLLHLGYNGMYYSDIFVCHPDLKSNDYNKIISYSLGFGALYKKESILRGNIFYYIKFHFDIILRILYILLPFSEYAFKKKKNIFFLILKNRLIGFYTYGRK